jgi:maltose O-acetyltransferase
MSVLMSRLRELKNLLFRDDPVARHRRAGAVIGERVNIQGGVVIDPSHACHIEIGDDVTLATRVHILAHDASTKRYLGFTRLGKVKIGNRVFIGGLSIILPGVAIGDDVVIGAGSVVCRDIPSGSVAAGNPAKVICSIQDFLDRRKKEMEIYPRFGIEYTDEVDVNHKLGGEMNQAMKDRFGYIL